MNNIIEFVIVMFLLSVICERVAEFFKNYLCGRKLFGWYLIGDTVTKYPPESLEELRRHYRILKLNLTIGFVTAFLCHASLFSIIQNIDDPGKVIGWPDTITLPSFPDNAFKYISFPIGCLLTGAFISVGSKFWHDLLDILLEVKNTKRTVNDELNAQGDYRSFEALPELMKVRKMEAAIEVNRDKWLNTIPNVTGVGIGNRIKSNRSIAQKVIRFEVSTKEHVPNSSERVPTAVHHEGYSIPTDVVPADSFEPQYAYPGNKARPGKCGASVSRDNERATGTISLKVKRIENGVMKYYLLTSGHVVMDKELKQGITQVDIGDTVDTPVVITPGKDADLGGIALGNFVEGRITNHTDSALVALSNPADLDENIYNIGTIGNNTRAIDQHDVDVTRVKFSGAFSGLVKDVVVRGFGLSKQGNYPREVGTIVLHQLITIDRCSAGGDSGAVVMDEQNRVIGLIVGASGSYTYVIPIQSIKKAHKQFIII